LHIAPLTYLCGKALLMRMLFLFLAMGLLLGACGEQAAESAPAEAAAPAMTHFGDSITPDEAISYEELVGMMKQADEMNVKVKAQVTAVCQTKGCWMNVASKDSTVTDTMFVQFLDYGFFMPKDLAGTDVVMVGKAYWSETSVEELRHYAEDDGQTKEQIAAITKPKRELKFEASGVVIPQ